jgi:hypothetical protein
MCQVAWTTAISHQSKRVMSCLIWTLFYYFLKSTYLRDTNLKTRIGNEHQSGSDPFKSVYESKLAELISQYDFHSYFMAITEAVNTYLKCIHQYPSLHNQLSTIANNSECIDNLISYILFQISLVNYVSSSVSQNSSLIVNWHTLTQSFMCVFNLLVDQQLLERLCQRSNYSTLVSHLVDNFYQLIVTNFFR